MQVSPATAPPVSPYVQRLAAFKTANNNFLIRSVISSFTALAQNQTQYAWGSDAAQMDSLSRTIAVLKQAYNSGLYGYERGWTGTKVDTKA
jgi:hypothetical protein